MRARRWWLVCVGSTLILAGCTDGQHVRDQEITASVERVPVEPGEYFGLAWPVADRLIIGVPTALRATTENDLYWLSLAGELEPLPLRDDGTCRRRDHEGERYNLTDYMFPTSMADGRIAFARSCRATNDPLKIMAFDPQTNERTTLFETSELDAAKPSFWNVDAREGISTISGDICATVVWLRDTTVEGLGVSIPSEDGDWIIEEDSADPAFGDCADHGRADWPSWAPDGSLSFFAETDSIGLQGFARMGVPYDLYLMDDVSGSPLRVAEGFLEPRSPVWSPDSSRLAFSVLRGDNSGTWLFSPETGDVSRISETTLLWLAWAPDGDRIAGITDDFNDDVLDQESHVVVLELPS